jgi:uncharacterized NAD(P)/FAD-binding protein YdhS
LRTHRRQLIDHDRCGHESDAGCERRDGEAVLTHANLIRRVLAVTRELALQVEERGGDWREVVTFIRTLAPALWRRLPDSALDLGLRTADYGACIDAQGASSRSLYYLGPMLRADHWEATAATELRNHAERLAMHLAAVAVLQGEQCTAP